MPRAKFDPLIKEEIIQKVLSKELTVLQAKKQYGIKSDGQIYSWLKTRKNKEGGNQLVSLDDDKDQIIRDQAKQITFLQEQLESTTSDARTMQKLLIRVGETL